jgi:hypothetical protein
MAARRRLDTAMTDFNTPEDMDDLRAALKASVSIHDELVSKAARDIAAKIERLCREARDVGLNLAVSPPRSEPPLWVEEEPFVYSMKFDTMMLKPGSPVPAGWTLYEVAK